ncbi:hypothetical protein GOBAR_AA08227 [Gossypium barbadense]|uniref:SMARCC C-terminal domain-containing protein n=1 Tax=Gossypium barbadense TaxID=3634 RepID=A0A2P5Y9Z6_GOSBA|nr:hypothetical protein GOBAR_AA08227 [Gossypium barbadense]
MRRRNEHVVRETQGVANDTGNRGAQNLKNTEDECLKWDQKSSLSNHGYTKFSRGDSCIKASGELSEPENASENLETASSSPSRSKNERKTSKPSPGGKSSKPAEALNDVQMVSVSQPSERSEPPQPDTSNSVNENGVTTDQIEEGKSKNHDSTERGDNSDIDKLKRAAVTTLSAAATLVEKQLHKMEAKLSFFNEMEGVVMRVTKQLDRSRQRLYHE